MNGGLGFTGQSPSAACRSVWQTPDAWIATWICPVAGLGTGTSSMVSGLPNSRTTAAFMVFAIRFLLGSLSCVAHRRTRATQVTC